MIGTLDYDPQEQRLLFISFLRDSPLVTFQMKQEKAPVTPSTCFLGSPETL